MRAHLHGLSLECTTNHAEIAQRWTAVFGPDLTGAAVAHGAAPDVALALEHVPTVPAAPAGTPTFAQDDHLHYYVAGAQVVAHFPRYARLDLDLRRAQVLGRMTDAALTTYGVFEDLVAIALGPYLRRRGLFPVHAFAAAWRDQAALLVGARGSGKTTTGISLLRAGWRLLSNDAPLLAPDGAGVAVLSYPGLLSAYPDTLARFPELRALAPADHPAGRKISFAAESVYPGAWQSRATATVLCFPRVSSGGAHRLLSLSAPEALRLLLPNAIDRWDEATVAPHFTTLSALTRAAPAYRLELGPEVEALPELLASLV